MVVIRRDHVSDEVGHSSGVSRVLLAVGVSLVVAGVVAFVLGVALGINEARSGVVSTEGDVWLLPAGGLAVSIGLVVSAVGMAWSRRSAGE